MSYAGIFTDKNNIDHPITSTLYGTCSTAAATAAKEVVCSNVDSLEAGMTLRVVFTNANTAASPTINVNSKGAKNVYRFGSTTPIGGNSWEAGAVVDLFYDGTSFFMLNSDNLGTAAAKDATNAVTENSTDLVESGAVYTGLATKADLTDLAPAFSTSTAYTVGQYVSYDGNLYKCTSAHSAGAWVAGDFTLVAVGSELESKQNATDNNLQTTNKTVVGAVNELKSGLTTLDNEVNGDATTYPYADVITIEDAVPSNLADCNVKIEPVQDLHGYDKPWVGGAWKNQFDKSLITSGNRDKRVSTGSGGTYSQSDYTATDYIKVKPNTDYTLSGSTGTTYVAFGDSNKNYVSGGAYTFGVAFRTPQTAEYIKFDYYGTDTATDGTIQLEEGDTATSYAPYENICPISGHTEASVQRDGKNLCDGLNDHIYINGDANKYGYNNNDTGIIIPTYNAQSLSVSTNISQNRYRVAVCDIYPEAGAAIDCYNGVNADGSNESITINTNGHKYIIVNATDITEIQVELGSSATDYEPFKGKTYTIALGDTIYGGSVDFNTGLLTINKAKYTATWGDGTKPTVLGTSTRKLFAPSVVPVLGGTEQAFASISNIAEYREGSWTEQNAIKFMLTADGNIALWLPTDTDSNTEVEFCYYIATPTTIQLTSTQIQLLKGQNTLTASTGDISVTVNGVSGSIGAVQEQVNELATDKQDVTDNTLTTTSKTVVGAINEVKSGLTNFTSKIAISFKGAVPNGKQSDNIVMTIPFWNPNNVQPVLREAYIYDSDGNFTDILSSLSIVTYNKVYLNISFPYNANYAGKMIRVDVL